MPRHTFPKGHKFAKGGKREGAGAPTKEEQAEKLSFLQCLEREREARASRLAARYFDMAEGKIEGDGRVLMHLVDTALPKAKQEFIHEVQHSADRDLLIAILGSKEARRLAEQMTKEITITMTPPVALPVPTNGNGNGNGQAH